MSKEKPKEIKVNDVIIKSTVSEDGKEVFIRMSFPEEIESYQQINYILNYYFNVADFKRIVNDKETIVQ